MSDNLNFQQIIDSVSFDDIVESSPYSTNTSMNIDEQKKELASVARMISKGHVGYELWSDEIKKQFETSIENLYNEINTPDDVKSFYQKLDKALQILPDEHLKVSPSKGNLLPREPNPISGEAFRGKFEYGVKIGSTHASFENDEIFERKGFPVDINTSGQDAYSYTLANIEAIKEQSRKKIAEYTHPTSKKEFNKLANNDFAFIRAINTGMDIEDVKGLYESLYPDKKENFQSIVDYAKKGVFSKK